MGIFKHCRGILRDWMLPEAEALRLQQMDEPEVVLRQRPLKLYVEIPTGTKATPTVDGKKLYTLTVQMKPWSLDKAGAVKIHRFGFPIVPDFGGTAHAYCGSTLPAALGDLLPWWHKPRLEDMLRGYIIKSRVKATEDIFIAQPYSPHLFRQGLLPGPRLLLDVLTKKLTTEEAKKAWQEHEEKKTTTTAGGNWMIQQELPCRRCTDKNNGVFVKEEKTANKSSDQPQASSAPCVLSITHRRERGGLERKLGPGEPCGAQFFIFPR